MGRIKISAVFQHFEYRTDSQTSLCLVEGCSSTIRGSHAGNLKTHLKTCHPGIFRAVEIKDVAKTSVKRKLAQSSNVEPNSPEPKQSRQLKLDDGYITRTKTSLRINMDSQTFMKGCVQLVTTNGRPFSIVEDSGFKTLMEPILKSLRLTVNRKTVVEALISQFAEEKNCLIQILCKKLLFLKIDVATRLDRHFLGVNVQFFDGSQMKLKTLGVVEIKDGSTKSEEIQKHVKDLLKQFEISPDQIVSITSDNGSNMLKTVRLMNESIADSPENFFDDDIDEALENETNEINDELISDVEITDEELNNNSLPEVFDDGDYSESTVIIPTIVSTKCAAHTLELAVRDALKITCVKNSLQRARQVVKKLRTPTLVSMVVKRFGKKPVLDNTTRWGSSYDMVNVLINMQDGVAEWGAANRDLRVSPRCWESLKIIRDVLKPVREATRLLQSEHLTPGDFYKIWTSSKINVQKFTDPFAKILLERMNIREKLLFDENPIMLAGIYFDPRYHVTLSQEQVTKAHEAILSISKRLDNLIEVSDQLTEHAEADESDDEEDPFEEFLKSKETNKEPAQTASRRRLLMEAFAVYEKIPRERNKKGVQFDLFNWWATNGPSILQDVARVIICLPATQVSVERLFSALAFVLSERRSRMKDDVLNAVLFLRTNEF